MASRRNLFNLVTLIGVIITICGPFSAFTLSINKNSNENEALLTSINKEEIIENPKLNMQPNLLLRDLLENQSDLMNENKTTTEIFQTKILSELEHLNTNARSYLDALRSMLMNFACRIGLKRFCSISSPDLPGSIEADNALPEVPPFPDEPHLNSNLESSSSEASVTRNTEDNKDEIEVKHETRALPEASSTQANNVSIDPSMFSPTLPQDSNANETSPDNMISIAETEKLLSEEGDVVIISALPSLEDEPQKEEDDDDSPTNESGNISTDFDQIKQNLTEPDQQPQN